MELRQLRYFLAVAETRHFGRAAERLHMAQSPLSQAVRRLEDHLGVALFERTTRRVDLTPAGEALRGEAVRILGSVDAARTRIEHVAAGRLGHVRLGVTGLATFSEVPALVRRLAERLPEVSTTFRTDMLTPEQEAALLDRRIDVGLLRPPLRDPGLAAHTLRRERFVLAVPGGHPRAEDASVALADLGGEDFVVYAAAGSVVDETVQRACRGAGFVPRRAHEADQTSVVLALVAAGRGVALLPESARAVGLAGVRHVPVDDPLTVDLALAWRRDERSPAVLRLLEVLGATASREAA